MPEAAIDARPPVGFIGGRGSVLSHLSALVGSRSSVQNRFFVRIFSRISILGASASFSIPTVYLRKPYSQS